MVSIGAPFASIPFAMLDNVFRAEARLIEELARQIRSFGESTPPRDLAGEFARDAFHPRDLLGAILSESAGKAANTATDALRSSVEDSLYRSVSSRWQSPSGEASERFWWEWNTSTGDWERNHVFFAPVVEEPSWFDPWWVKQVGNLVPDASEIFSAESDRE